MKQTKHLLLLAALLHCIATNAHDFEADGIYYNIISFTEKTVEVTYQGEQYDSYDEYNGTVIIPETVAPYRVIKIGANAFRGCDNLTSITIPEGVTSIGESAFSNCCSLTSIDIPESVTEIGWAAFYGCSSLTFITIPQNVISIEENAFSGCTSLKRLIIEDGSEILSLGYNSFDFGNIGQGLFYDCPLMNVYLGRNLSYKSGKSYGYSPFHNKEKLTLVTIGEKVTEIGDYAFSGCSGLKSITFPESMTEIGKWAFDGCNGITSITIPKSVTIIKGGAFSDCTSLKELTIEDGSETLSLGCIVDEYDEGQGLFYDCPLEGIYLGRNLSYSIGDSYGYSPFYNKRELTSVTIGEEVTSIARFAFYNCNALTSITIPKGITSIEDCAFDGCNGLTSITIPESITSIGRDAFDACGGLTTVHISSLEAWCKISFGNSDANPLAYAHNLYLNGELVTELTIPEGVTSIGDYAFYGCSSLTSITFLEGVTSIGNGAFYCCKSLTSITIPESMMSIGDTAFGFCSELIAVHISNLEAWCKISFYDYEANPLYYAHNLYLNGELVTELVIPEGVTNIGNYAFFGCNSLTSITIPESVTEIGSYAFYGCNGLTAVHISSLEDWCKISFGDSDANPLAYAHNLYLNGELVTELVIPEGITNIGSYAFDGCSSLTSITIPESVTEIDKMAFGNCDSLTEVHISSLEDWCEISFGGSHANPLAYAHNLYLNGELVTELVIPEGITNIGSYAFDGCSSLTSITIPESVTEIGSYAFYGCYRLTAITIPENVKKIGKYAFYGCTGLTSITSRAITPPRCATNTFKFVDTTIPVNVPQGSVADYQAAGIWKDFSTFIEFDPTEIESVTTNETKAPIYNLKGIRVSGNRDTLPAGMYIQNGKKFVVM